MVANMNSDDERIELRALVVRISKYLDTQEAKQEAPKKGEQVIPDYLTAPEVAVKLRRPLSYVYFLTHKRKIDFHRPGKRILFLPEVVSEFMEKHKIKSLN